MFDIIVVKHNCHSDSDYIGRFGSPLANPFPIKGEDTRDTVCDRYEEYFYEQLQTNNQLFLTELKRLYDKGKEKGYIKLGCFCKNNNEDKTRCHGDTIRNFFIRYDDSFFNHE
jgi:hypothetical protein